MLGPPKESDLEAFHNELKMDKEVLRFFKKIANTDKNMPIKWIDLLKAIPAFQKQKVYELKDLEMAADLLDKMVRWNPLDRITAEKALSHPFVN